MKVLITGAAGRIGRVLAQDLAADFDLRLSDCVPCPDWPAGVQALLGDITNDADVTAMWDHDEVWGARDGVDWEP